MPQRLILMLSYAADGQAMADAIQAAFATNPSVQIEANGARPAGKVHAVYVFILTPAALTDAGVARVAAEAQAACLPVLPVVEDTANYDFNSLPDALHPLKAIDAAAWGTDGAEAVQAIRRLLGFEPFRTEARVFISYRRSDGTAVAQALSDYLTARGYLVFLDTRDVDAGEVVQRRIHEEIQAHDLVLLINSPDAYTSSWVEEEIQAALTRQIRIMVVDVAHNRRFPMLRDLPGVPWNFVDGGGLQQVELTLIRVLTGRRRFDDRVRCLLHTWCGLRGWGQRELDRRRLRLTPPSGAGQGWLLEYEDAAHSLDRLYRLFLSSQDVRCDGAVFVHHGVPLSKFERDAVNWAAKGEPLHVAALEELVVLLEAAALSAGTTP